MDQGLKERLIGAAVLVALGVWLIPWVLDGKQEQLEVDGSDAGLRLPSPDEPLPVRTQTLRLDEPIAETTANEPVIEQEPTPLAATPTRGEEPVASAEAETHIARAAPESERTEAGIAVATPKVETSASPPKPVAAPTTVESKPSAAPTAAAKDGWVVQIGSFGEEENAKRQAQRVNTYGYKPEVSSVRTSGKPMYRVRVGPYPTRAQADATASALGAHGFVSQVISAE